MELRCETVTIRADRAEGMFRGMATLAAPGVYTYSDGVETWREYTPAETLADPTYLDSLRLRPVTLDHPASGEVTPDTARALTVGGLGDSVKVRDDGMLEAPLAVWDRAAMQAAVTTHPQISLGYRAHVEVRSGVTAGGQAFDRVQVKREANHVALVPAGRHGPRVRVRADGDTTEQPRVAFRVARNDSGSTDALASSDNLTVRSDAKHEVKNMAQVQIGNVRYDIPDAATATAIQQHTDRLSADLDTMKAKAVRADAAEAERDAAKAEVASLKTAHEAAIAQVRADAAGQVRERIALEVKAQGILGADYKAEGKTDRQIRADALTKLGVTVTDAQSDAYVAARFDVALEGQTRGDTAATVLSQAMNAKPETRADAAAPTYTSANDLLADRWA